MATDNSRDRRPRREPAGAPPHQPLDKSAKLVYREKRIVAEFLAKSEEAGRTRGLPPVLPIVVHVGTKRWTAPERLEDLLAGEAKAFLPFALGHEFVLVQEAEEARGRSSVGRRRARRP